MKKILLVMITLITIMLTLPVMANEKLERLKSIYGKETKKIGAEYKEELSSINLKYVKSLNTKLKIATDSGNLSLYKDIEDEKLRFAKEGIIPETSPYINELIEKADVSRDAKIVVLAKKYLAGLNKLKISFMKSKSMEEAKKVEVEVNKAKFIIADIELNLPFNKLMKGLVLHYDFNKDEGDKVIDLSGNDNHGKVHGAKWKVFEGSRKGVMGFDGVDDITETPEAENISFVNNEPFTVAIYFCPLANSAGFLCIKNAGYGIKFNGLDSPISFYNGSYLEGEKVQWKIHGWYHVVISDDGRGNCNIYVNGVKDKSGHSAPNRFNKFGLVLGAQPEPSHFKGYLDDIMIWNRILSEEEVKYLHRRIK